MFVIGSALLLGQAVVGSQLDLIRAVWQERMHVIVTFLAHAIDMRKGVNAALKTKYESKAWKKWFVDTAKRLMEKLDAESVDDNVSECLRNYFLTDTIGLRVAFRCAAMP